MINLEKVLPNKRCLAIDDLVESRAAMKKMLSLLGAKEVDVATDGDEASQMIQHNDYDLVISDYNLGRGKDGQQVLEEARFTRRLKATATFIMLTGENALDMVMGALEYEPDDYITKPFTINTMRKRLQRTLGVKENLTELNEAIDLRNHKDAVIHCKVLLKQKTPYKMKVLRIMGRELIKLKQFGEALKIYNKVLSDREVNWAYLGKATCLRELNKLNDALEVLDLAIEKFPLYVQCFDLMSKIKLQQKNSKAGQKILMAATKVSPKAVLRQMELGRIAYINKDFEVAEGAFRQAVKLARHSCYKSVKNYMNFVKTLQNKLDESNTREVRDRANEAFKAIDEIKNTYKENLGYTFEAFALESLTFKNIGKEPEANHAANKAEDLLGKMNKPTDAQKITMVETYLNTLQHGKAQALIDEIQAQKQIRPADSKRLKQAIDGIDPKYVRQYTTKLNDEAIRYFERGQLNEALKLFDKAIAYDEAGISVLLNAIQCKVAYMDQRSVSEKMVKSCLDMFDRIGKLPSSDDRYGRYSQLKKTCERLKRAL